jgi:hypothetical protein
MTEGRVKLQRYRRERMKPERNFPVIFLFLFPWNSELKI